MTPPRVAVAGPLATALRPEVLDTLGVDALSSWLRARRWFGGKGRTAVSVRFRDLIPLFPAAAVARLEVKLDDGRLGTYQLPLAVRDAGSSSLESPLARIDAKDGSGELFDAVEDPSFRERVGQSFGRRSEFGAKGTRWVIESIDDTGRRAIPRGMPGTLLAGEQSNTSIRYGDRAILKLYRRLERGENPDAEIGRFLATRTSFRNVPRLLGTIRFEDEDGSTSVAGLLQAFVEGSRDGWAYVLDLLRDHLRRGGTGALPFIADGARLGAVTRGLHDALASDPSEAAFAPEPVTAADLEGWRRQVSDQAIRSFDLLEKGDAAIRKEAEAVLERRGSILETIDATSGALRDDVGAKIRHHGDYHLGQILRGRDGELFVIDFEGEPARPLHVRRQRHSPLRDVAGMLRSFDYAAAAALRGESRAGSLADWRRDVRAAFLHGYRNAGTAPFLPRSDAAFRGLLFLFELEKALYELGYELDNRPDWVRIPLHGITALLEAGRE